MKQGRQAGDIYEHLRMSGLGYDQVSEAGTLQLLANWSPEKILEFRRRLFALIPRNVVSVGTPLDFAATSSMAGAPSPCAHTGCRLKQVSDLGHFAALYAKSVVLPSSVDSGYDDERAAAPWERINLLVFVQSLYHLKPLIESDVVSFAPFSPYCPHCYKKMASSFDNQWAKRDQQIAKYLRQRHRKEVTYVLRNDNESILVEITGPPDLVEHGGIIYELHNPPKAIRERLKKGDLALAPQEAVKHFGWSKGEIAEVLDDLHFQNYHARVQGYSYLSQRALDFWLINKFSAKFDPSSAAISPALSHHVPSLEDIDLNRVVRLRKAEPEAFLLYQNALTQVLKSSQGKSLKELKTAFDDAVRPEVVKIELAIKKSRRLLKDSIKDDLTKIGFIGIGVFSGLLPPSISVVLGALGGYHFAAGVTSKIRKLFQQPIEIRENPFFFHWLARRKATATSKVSSKPAYI